MIISTLNFGNFDVALYLLVAESWLKITDLSWLWRLNLSMERWEPSQVYLSTVPSLLFCLSAFRVARVLTVPCSASPGWKARLSKTGGKRRLEILYKMNQFWMTLIRLFPLVIFLTIFFIETIMPISECFSKVSKSLPSTTLHSVTVIIQFPPLLFPYFFPPFWYREFIVTVYAFRSYRATASGDNSIISFFVNVFWSLSLKTPSKDTRLGETETERWGEAKARKWWKSFFLSLRWFCQEVRVVLLGLIWPWLCCSVG